jgi:hypothetical protein
MLRHFSNAWRWTGGKSLKVAAHLSEIAGIDAVATCQVALE